MQNIKALLEQYAASNLVLADVGAKDGLEFIRGLESISTIHAFEPNPPEFNALRLKYAQHHFKALHLNDTGLSDHEGSAAFTVTQHASMSSLLEPDVDNYAKHFGGYSEFAGWRQNVAASGSINIRLQTLDGYLGNANTIDYLKLDTQGSELLILKGAEQLLKSGRIGVIKTEVSTISIYKRQAMFSDIDLYLRGLNYVLVDFITYRDNYEPLFSRAPARHFGPCGDAVYVLNNNRHKQDVIKKALVLAWLRYTSLAGELLREAGVPGKEADLLLSIADRSVGQQVKNAIRNLCPPALQRLFKK